MTRDKEYLTEQATNTIIIKLKQDYDISNNVKYRKD
jgi:hypothetical protein